MHVERSIDISAPPQLVWEVLAGIERWPEWADSVTSVTRLDDGPFGLGSRARVVQPGLGAADFEVIEFEPGRSFAWKTSDDGVESVASHRVEPAAGGTRATISVRFSGWPLVFIGWWVRRITNRDLTMETEGLKRRSEAG